MKDTIHHQIEHQTVVIEDKHYEIMNVPSCKVEYQNQDEDKTLNTEEEEQRTWVIGMFNLSYEVRSKTFKQQHYSIKQNCYYRPSRCLLQSLSLLWTVRNAENYDPSTHNSRHPQLFRSNLVPPSHHHLTFTFFRILVLTI